MPKSPPLPISTPVPELRGIATIAAPRTPSTNPVATTEVERLRASLIDEIIAMYHTTRLLETPASTHILSKGRVQYAFEAYEAALSNPVETAKSDAMREALEWQPIATAPKDGTRIILCWDDCPNLPAHVELGKFKQSEGVWCNTYGKAFSGESTHWMPLPPAPGARRVTLSGDPS